MVRTTKEVAKILKVTTNEIHNICTSQGSKKNRTKVMIFPDIGKGKSLQWNTGDIVAAYFALKNLKALPRKKQRKFSNEIRQCKENKLRITDGNLIFEFNIRQVKSELGLC